MASKRYILDYFDAVLGINRKPKWNSFLFAQIYELILIYFTDLSELPVFDVISMVLQNIRVPIIGWWTEHFNDKTSFFFLKFFKFLPLFLIVQKILSFVLHIKKRDVVKHYTCVRTHQVSNAICLQKLSLNLSSIITPHELLPNSLIPTVLINFKNLKSLWLCIIQFI